MQIFSYIRNIEIFTCNDTSVWIDHLRNNNDLLSTYLFSGKVVCHDFVIGELACSNLKNRDAILDLPESLPKVTKASDKEILGFIKTNKLYGKGIGLIDVHLLASAKLNSVPIWTLDKK